jgi:predicted nucleic acid binding AN1-type Zn finger protein
MVGECPRCENNFCGAHRLPEDHACPALSMFKRAAFEENRQKLAKEATIASKISAF